MPGQNLVILMLLLRTSVGEGAGEQVVKGVLHGRVELNTCHQHQERVTKVEWTKYVNSARRLLYMFEKPNITIFKPDNIYLNNQNLSLILVNLTEEDEAVYENKLFSGNQLLNQCNITLSVLSPPTALRIAVSTSPCPLTLRCEVRGEFLNLRWLRNGLLLPDDQRISFSERNKTVRVSNLNSSDWGTYTCRASNADGTSEAHVNITGENTTLCEDNRRAGYAPQTTEILFYTGLTLIPALLLCIILTFICTNGYCRNKPPKRRKDRREANAIAMEERVYDEPNHPQGEPDPPRVEPLPYVYSDFIKPNAQQASAGGQQAEDAGYSTIEEVKANVRSIQTPP